MTIGRNFPVDFTADAGASFGALAVDRKGRLILSPESNLQPTEAIVNNGDVVPMSTAGAWAVNGTAEVSASVLERVVLPGTHTFVYDGAVFVYGTTKFTFTVVYGFLDNIATEPA